MGLRTKTRSESSWLGAADVALDALRLPIRSGHTALLDGWRGLCILLVVAAHAGSKSLSPLGPIGVEFFFVLSGRLMAEILISKRQQLGLFFKRRMARVVPALALYVLVVGCFMNASRLASGRPLDLANPIAALFFFHNYLPAARSALEFEHTWSLAVEEHSYILLALIAVVARRKSRIAAALALVASLAALLHGIAVAPDQLPGRQFLVWRSDYRVMSVLLSFAIYLALRGGTELKEALRVTWFAPAAAALAVATVFFIVPLEPGEFALCTILAALAVNTLENAAPPVRALLQHPILLWFGTLSFSLYLWQQIFIVVPSGLPTGARIVGAIACAFCSFKWIEQPARNYLNGRWARPRPATDTLVLAESAGV